jgi:hypothetical protein
VPLLVSRLYAAWVRKIRPVASEVVNVCFATVESAFKYSGAWIAMKLPNAPVMS